MMTLALVTVLLAVPSKGPAPTPAKESQVHQNQAAKVHSEPRANQQATGSASPTPAQPSAAVTTGHQSDRGSIKKGHPAANGWEIVGTIAGVVNTVLLTLFSGALAVLAYRQWLAMDRQAKLIHRQAVLMGKQLASMKTTGDDTHSLASAAFLNQRAWVGFEHIESKPFVTGDTFHVGVDIRNTGKTPARGTSKMRVRILPEWEPPELADAPWLPCSVRSRAIFFPGALSHLSSYALRGNEPIIITSDLLRELHSGALKVFADGRIDYSDVFGVSHWSEFRFVWRPGTNVFSQCEEGNGTDDKWE